MTDWNIAVNTVLLRQDIEELNRELTALYRHMELLEGILRYMDFWTGNAKNTFQQSFERDYEQMRARSTEAERLVSNLVKAAQVYEDCETVVAELAAAVKIS